MHRGFSVATREVTKGAFNRNRFIGGIEERDGSLTAVPFEFE